MADISKCIDKVVRASSGKLSKDDAEGILKDVTERIDKMHAEGNVNMDDALDAMSLQKKRELKLMSLQNRRTAVDAVLKNRRFIATINDMMTNKGFKTPGEAIDAFLLGDKKFRARDSYDYRQGAIVKKHWGRLSGALEKLERANEFYKGRLDDDIAMVLSKGFKDGQYVGIKGVNIDPDIKAIAIEIRTMYNNLVGDLNLEGAYIGTRDDFLVRHRWSRHKIERQGKPRWFGKADMEQAFTNFRKDWLDAIDYEKTFGISDARNMSYTEQEKVEKVLRDIFNNIMSDTSMAKGGDPGALTDTLSRQRKIHFKDGVSELAVLKKYAFGDNLVDMLYRDIADMSRAYQALATFGHRPEEAIKLAVRKFKEQAKGNPNMLEVADSLKVENIIRDLDFLMGKHVAPQNATIHSIAKGVKNWTVASLLDGSTVSMIADDAFFANMSRAIGAKTGTHLQKRVLKYLPKTKNQRIMRATMGMVEGRLTQIHAARFTADAPEMAVKGVIDKLPAWTTKYNLMNYHNDSAKWAFSEVISLTLGEHADLAFKNLPEDTAKFLKMYGLEDVEWEILRKRAGDVEGLAGRRLLPSEVTDLTDAEYKTLLEKQGRADNANNRKRAFNELDSQFRALYNDMIDIAVPTPGAREQIAMTGNMRPGTVVGELLGLASIFKSFPVTIHNKILAREFGTSGGYKGFRKIMNKQNYRRIALAVEATTLGYLSIAIRDMLKGREPRPLFTEDGFNVSVLKDSMIRGGAGGLLGDLLLQEYDKIYRSPVKQLAGPVLSQLDDVAQMGVQLGKGNMAKAGKKGAKFALQNTPFLDIFYVKPVIDQLFVWTLREAVSPGSVVDGEYNFEREYGVGHLPWNPLERSF